MGKPSPVSGFTVAARAVSKKFSHWFPVPRTLFPSAAGIDVSDTSLKWMVLEEEASGARVRSAGQTDLPAGIVVNGVVENPDALAEALERVRAELGGIECAHAALPEESAFVFSMHVPEESSREQTLSMIEFELEGRVPLSPAAAIFDFDVIEKHDAGLGQEIGVVVFPRELVKSYATAFAHSGLHLLSLELEARSIARAVSKRGEDEPVTLIADFGRLRTGIAVMKRGVPIFTSTVAIGGVMFDRAITDALGLPAEEITVFKNEQGLLAKDSKHRAALDGITKAASALADEIARHHTYWDTRRNDLGERVTPVERVYIVGGSANLKGLADFLAGRIQAEVVRPDVWQNVCSFDEYIPPIDRRASLEYATAIGLALRSYHL